MLITRSVAVALVVGAGLSAPTDPPRVRANDNRQPAGVRRGDTVVLDLEVRLGRWFPESDDGPFLEVPAFAVVGQPPEIPGPLIRVSSAAILDVTVRNRLTDSTLTLHGFATHPAAAGDTVRLAPQSSHRFRFRAGEPGTYLYWATTGAQSDSVEREQLAGAFVVDPPEARVQDRVFVMNIWGSPQNPTAAAPASYRNALTINGKAWPYSERFSYTVGDSVHWRWLNATQRNHPMHLHGFYFEVRTKGSGLVDTVIGPDRRRLAVTEEMRPYQAMTIAWSPSRPGSWLFHCHITFHVVDSASYSVGSDHHHAEHMAGLVLGIDVLPAAGWVEPVRLAPRRLAMTIEERPRRSRSPRTIGVTVAEQGRSLTAQGVGPVLVVTRDQPTDVTVRNRLSEPTAVHWHGLELESYSDGVPGWSGSSARRAPMIAPSDSFVARLTLPRAGTFIYHTHLNDLVQLTSGLYGAIVVLEPGATFDATREHVFVTGWDGMNDGPPRIVLNGDSLPPPLELARDVAHRLRFVNIGPAQRLRFELWRDSTLVSWRRLAADGASLPPGTAPVPASTLLPVGTTADVEFLPAAAGEYRLTMGLPGRLFVTQRLVVR